MSNVWAFAVFGLVAVAAALFEVRRQKKRAWEAGYNAGIGMGGDDRVALSEALERAANERDDLRTSLRDSERRRFEVGEVIYGVIKERQAYHDLYTSLGAGCARAQDRLFLEIERLSHLAKRPISEGIREVMREATAITGAPLPAVIAPEEAVAKVKAIQGPDPRGQGRKA